jgi:hypothetical protein
MTISNILSGHRTKAGDNLVLYKTAREVVKAGDEKHIIKLVHESIGHAGIRATFEAVQDSYDFSHVYQDVVATLSECLGCRRNDAIKHGSTALRPIAVPDHPFSQVVDLPRIATDREAPLI